MVLFGGFVANLPDCDLKVSEFEIYLQYYVYFVLIRLGKVWTLFPQTQRWVK